MKTGLKRLASCAPCALLGVFFCVGLPETASAGTVRVAELITLAGDDFSVAVTNGYGSVQAAVDAAMGTEPWMKDSVRYVRVLESRRETVRISGGGSLELNLDGHVLFPNALEPDGRVLDISSKGANAPLAVSLVGNGGRLAGNIVVAGGTTSNEFCGVTFNHSSTNNITITVGDETPSSNGKITASGICAFEFWPGFVGNCNEPYQMLEACAHVQVGAKFAADQSTILINDEYRFKKDESGSYVLEEPDLPEINEDWKKPESWMSAMQQQTPISRLIMVSAHDAGMVASATIGVGLTQSVTQGLEIDEQMEEAGARYFDLRPRRVGYWNLHTWYTCHGPCIGHKISTCFKAAKEFLAEHPGEFVFMRISHYAYPELKELIDEIFDSHDSILFKRNDNPILNELSLAELRGKAVLIIDKHMLENGKYGVRLDPSKGIWGLDAQEGDACSPGKKGGYLYIHDDYANEDDFDWMKKFVFARWKKQSEYTDQKQISPESRAFMLCWQLTVGGHHGWSWTNSNRAGICFEHMEECLSEGIVSNHYVRPMLVNLDYVDKADFSIVNAYNEPHRKSGGRLRVPWATWDNKRKHPFVRFSLFSVTGGKTNFVEVADGYRDGDKCCFDLSYSCLGKNVTALFEYPAGSHDSEGRPVASDKKEFTDNGTDVDWDVSFPTMTTEYIDHTADGTEILGFVDENDLTRVTADTKVLEGGKKYVVWDDELTLDNSTLKVSGDAWLLLPDGKKVVIKGGVWVSEDSSLSIFGQRGGTGQLVADATAVQDSSNAGILVGGKVTIHGGTVEAKGVSNAAGIGGIGGWSGGTVTIYGGDVKATGGDMAAGIGGGYQGHVGNFTCYGGKVNAIGGTRGGAGIGSGVTAVSTLGTVTIYGGEVTAKGGEGAAAIGGGRGSSGTTVTIRGGTVKALGAGSSFGDGYKPTSGSPNFAAVVTISGGQVEWYAEMLGKSVYISGGIFNRRPYQEWLATSHSVLDNPAAETKTTYPYMVLPDPIPYLAWDAREKTLTNAVVRQWTEVTEGLREWEDGCWYVVARDVSVPNGVRVKGGAHLVLTDGATLTIPSAGDGVPGIDLSCGDGADGFLAVYGQTGGTGLLTATGGKNAAGIGGGDKCPGGSVTVNGGTVAAAGGTGAAGIGVGGGFCTDGNEAEIDGGSVTVNGGTVTATGSEKKGAGIDVGLFGAVTVNGGTVTAKCGVDDNFYSAGIRGKVTIAGGTVEATGGCSSAGIDGGGFGKGDGIGVAISGGKVTATARQAPGIRCERGGPGVMITGGEVTAIGGNYGAGIGGNNGYPAGSLLVTGGEVTASGGPGAAGIGGGTKGGNVIVTGGMVEATGGENGAGIGGGKNFSGGVVEISGGTVTATGGTGAAGIGGGQGSADHGTVRFDDWRTFAVRAGENETGAEPVLQTDYADDHAAKYAKIQPGVLLKIPAASTGYGYVVSNETVEARLVPASLADGTNTYAFAVGDSYGVYYALAQDYAWAKDKGPAANPLKGTIGADTEIPEVTPAPVFAVTVPAAEHATVAVTNDAVLAGTTNGVYRFGYGTSVSVSYAADDGWSVAENASTNIAELTASVAVTAPTITANVYTITFASKFGTAPEAMTYTAESSFPYALPTMTATVDRVFRGWTNDVYTAATRELATLPDPLGDIAFGAVWSPLITNHVTVIVGNGLKAVGAKDPPSLATNYTVMVEGPDLRPEDIGGYCVRTKGEAPGTYSVTFVCTRMPQDCYIEFTINPGTFMITPPVMFEAGGTVTAPKAARDSEFLKPNANATWKAMPDACSVFVKWVAAKGASAAVTNLLNEAGDAKCAKATLTLKIPADAQVKPTDIVATWKRLDEVVQPGQVAVMLRCDPAMGKVKGAGVYALGNAGAKKVSINATPAKGYMFAGWYIDSGYATPATFWTGSGKSMKEKDYREPSQSIMVTDNTYLFARFVAKSSTADPISWLRYAGAGYCGADASWFAEEETWYQGVALPTNGCAVAFGSLSLPTVKVSGLPGGVKFDKRVCRFTGVPTACSTEKKPFFTVTITVKNKSGANDVLVKNVYVRPLPAWAVGNFDGYHMEEGVTNGTFTATVGKTGKVSGKTKGGWADTTFSAKNFSEVKLAEDGANLVYAVDVTVSYKDPATRKTVKEVDTLYLTEDAETGLGVIGGGDEDGNGCVGVQRKTIGR